MVKELLVQPEGFPVERLYSQMACPKGTIRFLHASVLVLIHSFVIDYKTDFDEDKSLVWDLSLPSDLVEGSARAWVTAVGDLMGPALQVLFNIHRLMLSTMNQLILNGSRLFSLNRV